MKGSYVLVIFLENDSKIRAGGLGLVAFKRGFYCYVGSALGPGGIEKRVGRHLKTCKEKKCSPHWHIDRLLLAPGVSIMEVFASRAAECRLSDIVMAKSDGSVGGFGCSDCNCRSHLHFFAKPLGGFLKLACSRYEHENARGFRVKGRNDGRLCQGNSQGP